MTALFVCLGMRTEHDGAKGQGPLVDLWAVGDMTLAELVTDVPLILGGLRLAALGTKVDDAATKPCRSKAGSLN